jgi:hypothetical protein
MDGNITGEVRSEKCGLKGKAKNVMAITLFG